MLQSKLRKFFNSLFYYCHTHPRMTVLLLFLILVVAICLVFYFKEKKKKAAFNANSNTMIIIVLAGLTIAISILIVNKKQKKASNCVENVNITHTHHVFGIDLSHYQGTINWNEFKQTQHPIRFIFIRATMGALGIDKNFSSYWNHLENSEYIIGAYHYYRPNENTESQFQNFKNQVNISAGHLIPVLDIEKQSIHGNKNLKLGLKKWLILAERHYGTKPIIYTGLKFYLEFLQDDFSEYPLWIASYSNNNALKTVDWDFHQFTDKIHVRGIDYPVDGNNFRGSIEELKNKFCL